MADDSDNFADETLQSERADSALYLIDRLGWLTRRIRRIGFVSAAATLVNVGLLAVLPIVPKYIYLNGPYAPNTKNIFYFLPVVLVNMLAIGALSYLESVRRRAAGYFQELSDLVELEGSLASRRKNVALVRKARITSREFQSASDMPFIPGRAGPGVYAAVNLIILTVVVVLFY